MTEQEWEDKLDEVQKHSENWYNKWKQSEEKVIELEQKLKQTEKDLENKKLAIKNKKAEIKLLGERCNQLLKDKGNLTDQIADIKANCDLAIEGRDVKIKELDKKNAELEQQIEKMKCPWNCKKFGNCKLGNCPCDKWELAK